MFLATGCCPYDKFDHTFHIICWQDRIAIKRLFPKFLLYNLFECEPKDGATANRKFKTCFKLSENTVKSTKIYFPIQLQLNFEASNKLSILFWSSKLIVWKIVTPNLSQGKLTESQENPVSTQEKSQEFQNQIKFASPFLQLCD